MVWLHPPLPHAFGLGDPGDQDVDMNDFHPKTSPGSCHNLPPDPASDSDVTGEPSSTDVDPGVTIQHGETLIVSSPLSLPDANKTESGGHCQKT